MKVWSDRNGVMNENYKEFRPKDRDTVSTDYEYFKGVYIRYLGDFAVTIQHQMPEEAARIRDFILRTAQFAWTKTSRPGYRISDDWADPIDFHND